MLWPRVIPCLLLDGLGLAKGVGFRKHRYVGDPINAVRIFNHKEVDELIFLDITATRERRLPPAELIQKIADQCNMPFAVGGGLRTIEDMRAMLKLGAEKVCVCTAAVENPALVSEAAGVFGSQAVVVSIDYRKPLFGGDRVYVQCGTRQTSRSPLELAVEMEKAGAGEILLNSIARDGTMEGYDLELVKQVSDAVKIPVIACGGAGSFDHIRTCIAETGCAAAAAGSMFVFHGPKRAVLINYPSKPELAQIRQGGAR